MEELEDDEGVPPLRVQLGGESCLFHDRTRSRDVNLTQQIKASFAEKLGSAVQAVTTFR